MIKTYKKQRFNLAKVLVTSIYGHEDMLNYLSTYRTQDKMRGVHYYPSGALCWFETNRYGDPIGPVYLIKRIPDLKLLEEPKKSRSFKYILKKKGHSLSSLFSRERPDVEEWPTEKPCFNDKERID